MSEVVLKVHKSEGEMKVSPADRIKAKIINWLLPKQITIKVREDD